MDVSGRETEKKDDQTAGCEAEGKEVSHVGAEKMAVSSRHCTHRQHFGRIHDKRVRPIVLWQGVSHHPRSTGAKNKSTRYNASNTR